MDPRTTNPGAQLYVGENVVYTFKDAGKFVIGLPGDDFTLKVTSKEKPSKANPEADRKAVVGAQIFVDTKPVYTFAKAGTFIIGLPGGDDLRVIVTEAAKPVPAPMPPVIEVGEADVPRGTLVKPGERLQPVVNKTNVVWVERGGVYADDVSTRSGTEIYAVGDASKPPARINGRIVSQGDKGLKFVGIRPNGFKLYDVEEVDILRCAVIGASNNGINCEGADGERSKNVRIIETLIADCFPTDGHRQGIYASFTDGLVVTLCVISGNGWKIGQPKTATIYNHGFYAHASCGPVRSIGNVYHANASHGFQQRSGGDSIGDLYLDNAIHHSYGLVNGSPCHPGGVSGTIAKNAYIGGRDIAGAKRGWALEVDNIKSADIAEILIAHDAQRNSDAIHLGGSQNVQNANDYVGIRDLTIERVYCWDWAESVIDKRDVGKQSNVGIAPPVKAELRATLGADFMARARANPGAAARDGLARIKAATGL